MMKLICMLLALALALCGCAQSAAPTEPTAEQTDPAPTVEAQEIDPPEVTLHTPEKETEASVPVGAMGAARVDYVKNGSYVRYITRPEDLPAYEALDGYRNDEYFAGKALLVVLDTVTSGSVKVSIGSVGEGTVTLARQLPNGEGTDDMATWLLWAEVEQGLGTSWTITNPGVQSNLSTY